MARLLTTRKKIPAAVAVESVGRVLNKRVKRGI
jgi:hypothetical protein